MGEVAIFPNSKFDADRFTSTETRNFTTDGRADGQRDFFIRYLHYFLSVTFTEKNDKEVGNVVKQVYITIKFDAFDLSPSNVTVFLLILLSYSAYASRSTQNSLVDLHCFYCLI